MMTVDASFRQFLISVSLAVVLVMCCLGSPTSSQRYERALPNKYIPTENKDSNSLNDETDKFFEEFWHEKNGGLCPFGQMPQRNNTVCCYVTACGPGYEIEECRENGTEDKCSKCKNDLIQLNNISSLNMEEGKCFQDKMKMRNEICPEDMRSAREKMNPNFPRECECKLEKCYIGVDAGTCILKRTCGPGHQLNKTTGRYKSARKILDPNNFPHQCECSFEKCLVVDDVGDCVININTVCGPNFQMNRITGLCEPCPWHGYKYTPGCEPCTNNITLLRYGKPGGVIIQPASIPTTTTDEVLVTSEVPHPQTSQEKIRDDSKTGGQHYIVLYIGFGVIALALVAVAIILGIRYCRKPRTSRFFIAPPTPTTEPLLPGQTLLHNGIVNGFQNGNYQNINTRNNGHLNGTNYNQNNIGNGHLGNGSALYPQLPYDDETGGVGFDNEDYRMQRGVFRDRFENGDVSVQNNGRVVNGRINQPPVAVRLDLVNRPAERDNHVDGGVRAKEFLNKQGESKRRKNEYQQAAALDSVESTGVSGQDERSLEDQQGAVGGASAHDFKGNIGEKVNDETGGTKVTKKSEQKQKSAGVSIHGNKFKDCNFFFSGKNRLKVGVENDHNKQNMENLKNIDRVSGTFEMSSSNDSSGISSSPTFELPHRRSLEQRKENASYDSSVIESKDEPLWREDLDELGGKGKPPCRPELSNSPHSGSPGCNIQPTEERVSGNVDESVATEKDLGHKTKAVEDGKPQNTGPQKKAVIVTPFQPSAPRGERPTARVPPIRQNSEVRHVSGYPSERPNDVMSNEQEASINSMSYAFMHQDSELSNGYMDHDIANEGDFRGESMLNHCGRIQLTSREDGCGQTSDMQRNQNAVPPTRRDVSRVGVTHSVPPMGERQGPEGNSITYTPENDHFVSRPDVQETDRKVALNETDPDITQEKLVGNNDTTAKSVDIDDDVTEYKRKIKETKNDESDTDLKKSVNGKGNNAVSEDSFEIKYNVEDILYEDDETTVGKSSVNENTDDEKSFEVESADIKNIKNSEKDSCDRTKCDEMDSDEISQSFEIESKDYKVFENANAEASSAVNEKASETDQNDTEQTGKDKAFSKPVTEESIGVGNYNLTSSAESSFEINSSEIGNIILRGNADGGEPGDRTADGGEPDDRTADGGEPGDRTVDDGEPGDRTVDGGEPGDRTVDDGEPGDRTADGGEPGDRTADGGEPGDRTVDDGEPGDRTADGGEPGDRTVDGGDPGDRTADGGEPGDRTVDGGEPGDRTVDGGEPGDRTADGGEPGDRTVDGGESGDSAVDGDGTDSQYSPMTSGDELTDSEQDE